MTQDNNDLLAERYRAACEKTDRASERFQVARADWIEATLEKASVVLEARNQFRDNHAFSRWLERNSLQPLTEGERAALLGFARDPVAARKLLTESTSYKVRTIWENVPKGMQRPPSDTGGRRPAPKSRTSGYARQQRAKRIPTVMQEPYQRLQDLVLTREQVDPNFKGTSQEFSRKYGHVPLHTKEEIEYNKRQEALQNWLRFVTSAGQAAAAVPAYSDSAMLAYWMEKTGKRAKFDGWIYALETAAARLKALLPRKTLDEVEAELDAIGKPPQ